MPRQLFINIRLVYWFNNFFSRRPFFSSIAYCCAKLFHFPWQFITRQIEIVRQLWRAYLTWLKWKTLLIGHSRCHPFSKRPADLISILLTPDTEMRRLDGTTTSFYFLRLITRSFFLKALENSTKFIEEIFTIQFNPFSKREIWS